MRVAIFGCGSIGTRHARNATALGGCRLLVFDPEPARVSALAAEIGAAAAATLADAWAWRPDVAVIAAPSFLHLELAREAVRRGCDLFVEKPLADRSDGVAALVAEASDRGLVTLVGCNMRFHPGPATVKRLLEAGAIGAPLAARLRTGSYLPSWRPATDYRQSYSARRQQGGGAILDCIHEIDLALWYSGPARLTAAVVRPAASLGLDVEGLAELLLQHTSGVVSSVHLNFVQRDYQRGCELVGSTGSIYWDFHAPVVTVRRGSSPDGAEVHQLPEGWSVNDMYLAELRHLFECVARRQQTIAPLAAGAAALEIALAARLEAGRVAGSGPATTAGVM